MKSPLASGAPYETTEYVLRPVRCRDDSPSRLSGSSREDASRV
jgi:hypothetical protein